VSLPANAVTSRHWLQSCPPVDMLTTCDPLQVIVYALWETVVSWHTAHKQSAAAAAACDGDKVSRRQHSSSASGICVESSLAAGWGLSTRFHTSSSSSLWSLYSIYICHSRHLFYLSLYPTMTSTILHRIQQVTTHLSVQNVSVFCWRLCSMRLSQFFCYLSHC